MQVKNNVAVGALVGLILPLLAYFIAEVLFRDQIFPDKPGVPYLIAVGVNLILLKSTYKAHADKAGSGLLVVTFVVLLLAFAFKIKLR